MEIFAFIFYLALFNLLIINIPFFNKSGISRQRLIALFTGKVLAGLAYAKFYTLPKYYTGADTWRFYHLSIAETSWLRRDPVAFIKDLFVYGYSNPGNLFKGENTYWNDLKSNVPVKLLAVINLVTNNSYYCDIIFFNFLFMIGLVALFKMLSQLYAGKTNLIITGVFLLPSTLFWCSGIHKDGLILSATGVVIYCVYKEIKTRFSWKRQVAVWFCLLLIFSLRNYVLFALLPCMAAWWVSSKIPDRKWMISGGVFIAGAAAFFIVPLLLPSINLPLFIAGKQHEFLLLQGGSEVISEPLKPSLNGFISYLPKALDMAFLRPHVSEIKNISYLPAAAETILILLLFLVAGFSISKRTKIDPSVLFLFSFSLVVLLLCGYTIPVIGAVVRYKSFVLPLLVTPLLCMIDIPKLTQRFR